MLQAHRHNAKHISAQVVVKNTVISTSWAFSQTERAELEARKREQDRKKAEDRERQPSEGVSNSSEESAGKEEAEEGEGHRHHLGTRKRSRTDRSREFQPAERSPKVGARRDVPLSIRGVARRKRLTARSQHDLRRGRRAPEPRSLEACRYPRTMNRL